MTDSGRFGLKRSLSLKRARLVRPLFDRSRSDVRSVSAGCVRIMYRAVPQADLPGRVDVQAVFVVSRRSGSAVVRNRIKRRVRETYRRLLPTFAGIVADSGSALTMAIVFRGNRGDDKGPLGNDLETAMRLLTARFIPIRNSH